MLTADAGRSPFGEESKLLTTFVTPSGRYCFNCLPFGICCAPEIFHHHWRTGNTCWPNKHTSHIKVSPSQNVKDFQCFMRMVNHLSKFIPRLAEMSKPLHQLLCKDSTWICTDPRQRAFAQIKTTLTPVSLSMLWPLSINYHCSWYLPQ